MPALIMGPRYLYFPSGFSWSARTHSRHPWCCGCKCCGCFISVALRSRLYTANCRVRSARQKGPQSQGNPDTHSSLTRFNAEFRCVCSCFGSGLNLACFHRSQHFALRSCQRNRLRSIIDLFAASRLLRSLHSYVVSASIIGNRDTWQDHHTWMHDRLV